MARKPKSGLKSSINPDRELVTETRGKLFHGHREWKMIRLRELIREHEKRFRQGLRERIKQHIQEHEKRLREAPQEKKKHFREVLREEQKNLKRFDLDLDPPRLPDNYLSLHAKANAEIARRKLHLSLEEIDACWRDEVAEFERAVLDGAADWFQRQAKVLRSGDTRAASEKAWDRFEAAVLKQLEVAFWRTRIAEGDEADDAMLGSSARRAGATVQQILDCFSTREEKHGNATSQPFRRFYVRIAPGDDEIPFENRRRARESITRIAALSGFELERK